MKAEQDDRRESWARKHVRLLKEAFDLFKENHPIKFASAIAYFSLFALPSAFLIIVYLLGFIFGRGIVYVELREQLTSVIGHHGSRILVNITKNFEDKASESWWMAVIYGVVVFWLSTQLFRLFQNALNDLWLIKPDFDSTWKKQLMERGLTFVLVLSSGLVFFASWMVELALSSITGLFGLTVMHTPLVAVLSNILTAGMVMLWFAWLYKVLPFVRINWRPALQGAAFTTILFFIGLWALWKGVVERDLREFYEESHAIIHVALWIFYSALIFLYGAAFTLVSAREQDQQIKPASYAYKYKLVRDDEFHEEHMDR